MNGNLVVFMVAQERMGSPEAVVKYSQHITFKKHCQSMALHQSNFCLVTPRERALRDETKRLLQRPIPYCYKSLQEP